VPIIDAIKRAGATTLQEIADALNAHGAESVSAGLMKGSRSVSLWWESASTLHELVSTVG
jgi:hypothetical protein